MDSYHVIDILIDRPHIKRTLHLPVWVRHVTGVLFFPVIPPPEGGIPDGEPLGTAGISLQNERLDAVSYMKVYKKSPVYYESPDYKTAGGEIFLDRGYGNYDFFQCNDTVSPNSFAVFVYSNRKNVKSPTDAEQFNTDFARLKSLVGKRVRFNGSAFTIYGVQTKGDIIVIYNNIGLFSRNIEFHKNYLSEAIYAFTDPVTGDPFFKKDGSDQDYDRAFTMKLILRHRRPESKSETSW